MSSQNPQNFWREAIAWRGSITPAVLPYIATFGVTSGFTILLGLWIERQFGRRIALEVAPFEIVGAVLGLLLVLRTNAGYDRWWEARKLWGGIVNQSRNLAITALTYGPADPEWRRELAHWTAAFPHVARANLRGEPLPAEVAALLGPENAERVAAADHMPSYVALKLGRLLGAAAGQGMDRFAFAQADRERALLIDHIGACERILRTPLPRVYAIKVRRFIFLFLATLPLALLHSVDREWTIPLITMMVAYPLISLDQIAVELQAPFSRSSHALLLDQISATIERNVLGVLREVGEDPVPGGMILPGMSGPPEPEPVRKSDTSHARAGAAPSGTGSLIP